MRTGIPAILLVTPAAAGLATRGASACAQLTRAGASWAPIRRLQSGPRPNHGRACPRQRPRPHAAPLRRGSALAPGGGPPIALTANAVPAVQRSDLRAAAPG